MVARPPPPPPTIGAICLIRSTADSPRSTADWSTLASRCTLPSAALPSTTTAGASLRLQPVGHLQQGVRIDVFDHGGHDADAALLAGADSTRADSRPLPAAPPPPPPGRCSFLSLRAQLGDLALERGRPRTDRSRRCVDRDLSGDRLDPAHALRRAGLAQDHERADLGGRADVRAAAQLLRELGDLDHPHVLAVLLAEQHHRAQLAGVSALGDEDVHRPVLDDLLVDDPLDLGQLLGRQRRGRGGSRSAACPGPTYEPACVHVRAQHLAQRRVQQVGRRVVRHRRAPQLEVDVRAHALAGGELAALDAGHDLLVVVTADDVLDRRRGRSRTRSRRGRRPGRRRPGRTATRAASA